MMSFRTIEPTDIAAVAVSKARENGFHALRPPTPNSRANSMGGRLAPDRGLEALANRASAGVSLVDVVKRFSALG